MNPSGIQDNYPEFVCVMCVCVDASNYTYGIIERIWLESCNKMKSRNTDQHIYFEYHCPHFDSKQLKHYYNYMVMYYNHTC